MKSQAVCGTSNLQSVGEQQYLDVCWWSGIPVILVKPVVSGTLLVEEKLRKWSPVVALTGVC